MLMWHQYSEANLREAKVPRNTPDIFHSREQAMRRRCRPAKENAVCAGSIARKGAAAQYCDMRRGRPLFTQNMITKDVALCKS